MGVTNRAFRRSSAALAIAFSSLGLGACGGSSSPAGSPATTAASAAGGHTITSYGRAGAPAPSSGAESPAHSNHGPGGFRVPKGDNSVPDFGAEANVGQRGRAVAALVAFMRARAGREWSKVCQRLARPLLRQLSSATGDPSRCPPKLGALLRERTRSELADTLTHGVAALRTEGDTAFALFYGPGAAKYVMPMQLEAGRWKMTQLAPLPYPLGTPAPAS